MRETQRLEPFNLSRAERALMAGRAQAQRRQRMHRRRRNGELWRTAHVDRQDGTDFSTERERDGLLDAIALGDGVRLRARLRRAIGLEGCIAPVALIFHLEDIALHFNRRGDAGVHHFEAERPEIEERLMRGNFTRERTLFRGAVGVTDADRFTGTLRDGMQDANADAIALEVRMRFAAERELNPAAGIARHRAGPSIVNRPALADGIELEAERIRADLAGAKRNLGENGGPIVIPDRGIRRAQHLVVPQADVTQERGLRFEQQRQRSGTQFNGARHLAAGTKDFFR